MKISTCAFNSLIKKYIKNVFLQKLLLSYYFKYFPYKKYYFNNFYANVIFVESIKQCQDEIKAENDLNETIFFKIVNFIKNQTRNLDLKWLAIKILCTFYRFLNNDKEINVFKNTDVLSIEIISINGFYKKLADDYQFIKYSAITSIPFKSKKICLTIDGLNRFSTRIKDKIVYYLDFSSLNYEYSDLLLQYIIQNKNNILIAKDAIRLLNQMLILLQTIKNNNKTDFLRFSLDDAVSIKQETFSKNPNNSLYTLANKIGWIRRFLLWLKTSNKATFQNAKLFFKILKSPYTQSNTIKDKIIPKDDLLKINAILKAQCNNGTINQLIYIIFILLLQTEFRISQICSLEVDCIKCSNLRSNDYYLYSRSKTSHGDKQKVGITNFMKNKIIESIELTNELRGKATNDTKKYVFLYLGQNHWVKRIDADVFLRFLRKACKKANIKIYNAKNLRCTHMTLSELFIEKNNRSEFEMSILSGHKSLKTTYEHYIQGSIQQWLEATYKVSLDGSNIYNPTKNIKTLKQNSNTNVANNCGFCSAAECNSFYPCLTCRHFATTPNYIPFFKEQIDTIDKLIKLAINRHDIENLQVLKTLHVKYLQLLYEKLEKDN